MAQIRIINVDFYMNAPVATLDVMYSEFRGASVKNVPVIRIFGTSRGYKTCLHVHGVFPYIYIPYDGKGPPDSITYQVASSLDKAINISLGQASSNAQHVYKVTLVSGTPFYGYHPREHQFLKIYFYNPLIVKKACNLLQQGNVLGTSFQTHEAHVPYILQFMIDYNLHGMSFVNLSHVKHRFDPNDADASPDSVLPTLRRMSVCRIECDALAEHILNKEEVAGGNFAVNPGIKALWDDEMQRRRNKGEVSQIGECLTQSRTDVPQTATHEAFKIALREKLAAAESSQSNDSNFSVYAAETPSSVSLLNASLIESHSLGVQDFGASERVDDSNLDESVFDEDAQEFLQLLEDLRENNKIEEDSILSQVSKVVPAGEDEDDNEVDLSLPFHLPQTSQGSVDDLDDSFFDSIAIPQLDGTCDFNIRRTSNRLKKCKTNEVEKSSAKQPPGNATKEAVTKRRSERLNGHQTAPRVPIGVENGKASCKRESQHEKLNSKQEEVRPKYEKLPKYEAVSKKAKFARKRGVAKKTNFKRTTTNKLNKLKVVEIKTKNIEPTNVKSNDEIPNKIPLLINKCASVASKVSKASKTPKHISSTNDISKKPNVARKEANGQIVQSKRRSGGGRFTAPVQVLANVETNTESENHKKSQRNCAIRLYNLRSKNCGWEDVQEGKKSTFKSSKNLKVETISKKPVNRKVIVNLDEDALGVSSKLSTELKRNDAADEASISKTVNHNVIDGLSSKLSREMSHGFQLKVNIVTSQEIEVKNHSSISREVIDSQLATNKCKVDSKLMNSPPNLEQSVIANEVMNRSLTIDNGSSPSDLSNTRDLSPLKKCKENNLKLIESLNLNLQPLKYSAVVKLKRIDITNKSSTKKIVSPSDVDVEFASSECKQSKSKFVCTKSTKSPAGNSIICKVDLKLLNFNFVKSLRDNIIKIDGESKGAKLHGATEKVLCKVDVKRIAECNLKSFKPKKSNAKLVTSVKMCRRTREKSDVATSLFRDRDCVENKLKTSNVRLYNLIRNKISDLMNNYNKTSMKQSNESSTQKISHESITKLGLEIIKESPAKPTQRKKPKKDDFAFACNYKLIENDIEFGPFIESQCNQSENKSIYSDYGRGKSGVSFKADEASDVSLTLGVGKDFKNTTSDAICSIVLPQGQGRGPGDESKLIAVEANTPKVKKRKRRSDAELLVLESFSSINLVAVSQNRRYNLRHSFKSSDSMKNSTIFTQPPNANETELKDGLNVDDGVNPSMEILVESEPFKLNESDGLTFTSANESIEGMKPNFVENSALENRFNLNEVKDGVTGKTGMKPIVEEMPPIEVFVNELNNFKDIKSRDGVVEVIKPIKVEKRIVSKMKRNVDGSEDNFMSKDELVKAMKSIKVETMAKKIASKMKRNVERTADKTPNVPLSEPPNLRIEIKYTASKKGTKRLIELKKNKTKQRKNPNQRNSKKNSNDKLKSKHIEIQTNDSRNFKFHTVKTTFEQCLLMNDEVKSKPKFRVVPAKRVYTYHPRKTDNETKIEEKTCEFQMSYPNTSWTSCVSRGQSVEGDGKKIEIISNRVLQEHEKYHVPNLLEGTPTTVITNNRPKITDRDIMNVLSNLYDEVVTDSKNFGGDVFDGDEFERLLAPDGFEKVKHKDVSDRSMDSIEAHIRGVSFDDDCGFGSRFDDRRSPIQSKDCFGSWNSFVIEESAKLAEFDEILQSSIENECVSRCKVQDNHHNGTFKSKTDDMSIGRGTVDTTNHTDTVLNTSIANYVECGVEIPALNSPPVSDPIDCLMSDAATWTSSCNLLSPLLSCDDFDALKGDQDYRYLKDVFYYEMSEHGDIDFRCSFANRSCNVDSFEQTDTVQVDHEGSIFLGSSQSMRTVSPEIANCENDFGRRCGSNDENPCNRKRKCGDEFVGDCSLMEREKNDDQDEIGFMEKPPTHYINQLRYVDGPNDSSSSEDERPKKIFKMRHKAILSQPPQYSPLTVKFGSPRKSTKKKVVDFQDHINESSFSQSKEDNEAVPVDGATKIVDESTNGDDQRSHKRKLSFSQLGASTLNSTSVEENLMCRHKSSSAKKELIRMIDINETRGRDLNDFEDTEQKKKISQNSDSVRFSDDLFSPDNDDVVISPATDDPDAINAIAEAYDHGNNFIPMPGTSACTFLDVLSSETAKTSSSGEITPYQVAQIASLKSEGDHDLTKNLSIYDGDLCHSLNEDGSMVVVPKYNPPTRESIESTLSQFNIPEMRHQEPFYGDCDDVTGNVEVGHKVLKIPSKTVVDLVEFESSFDGLECHRKIALRALHHEKLNAKEVTNYKLAYCKDLDCLITPIKLPPSRKDVEDWLEVKTSENVEVKIKKKKRIIIPRSPGAASGDSCDSMSISPCTPMNDKNHDENSVIKKTITHRRKSRLSMNLLKVFNEIDETIHVISDEMENDTTQVGADQICIETGNHQITTQLQQRSREKTSDGSHETLLRPRLKNQSLENSCGISGVTLDNTHNFAMSVNNLQDTRAVTESQNLTVLSMELHVETRGDLKPSPDLDPVRVIVYSVCNESDADGTISGAFVVDSLVRSPSKVKLSILDGVSVNCRLRTVDSEMNLFSEFITFVKDCDPDIIVGYEIEMSSWGFLIARGYVLGLNLMSSLSRVPDDSRRKNEESDLKITGRIVLDLWRLLRHEIALQSYTFENIVYHVLHQRVPLHSFKELSFWWTHPTSVFRHRTINHYLFRTQSVLKLMDQLDLIGRTSELARLFGIQFYEVLSRGSQFRVESMMLRLAKPLNYIAVSPTVQQRAKMRAPESLPLILEPESRYYADPMIVLDFQSLYPSMIIAYNYCFSTCLGRVEHLGRNTPFEFGATQLKVSRRTVARLLEKDRLNISPCGVAFIKKQVREGILPKMLQEILSTRLMVKKSMKENVNDKRLGKVLHARQLGLKLIANVTYGYTAANFSGRMPAIEVADSVVSKGRETLQRAINLVERTPRWGARVVYGDTDSLFVLIAGKSREAAFKIGAEIAEAVTLDNPSPVKLKLEKVFQPCILQTKKSYVGYMYESPDQRQPEFCAKGIETVRRDGCPAASKMLEKCLKMLFDTQDVSLIRKYVLRQFGKLLAGRVSIQDLTFAKEYRGSSGYRPGACVPALELTRKWTAVDKRNEPRSGERVPYVIIHGPPGLPLIRLVRSPRELLADPSLRPNAVYYITKAIIPPINRCFMLLGADLNTWYNNMPRKQLQYLPISSPTKAKKSTISQYFSTTSCAICGQQSQSGLCASCLSKPQESAVVLNEKVRLWEKNYYETSLICQSCCGRSEDLMCISLDCPVLYKRTQTERDVQQAPFARQLISSLPQLDF